MIITRRRFLKSCAVAALWGGTPILSGCGDDLYASDQPQAAEGAAYPPAYPTEFELRNDLGTAPDAQGAPGLSGTLARFGHITDTHITLDEYTVTGNPALESLLDSLGGSIGFGGLDRPLPQERYDVDVLQAVLQTMNAIYPPLDAVLHTGDALDIGVGQEAEAFLREFQRCAIPVVQCVGNHDTLALGNIRPVTAKKISALDFLDTQGFLFRHFLRIHRPTLTAFGSLAMGFDFCPGFDGDPSAAKSYYAFNIKVPLRDSQGGLASPGIRCYTLDTANPAGGADGALDEDQRSWFSADLDAHPDSLCLVMCHHPVNRIGKGRDDFVAILYNHPQVIAVLCGHDHRHRIRAFSIAGSAERGFWQIETGSLIDYPQQARFLEVTNLGDGTGRIRTYVFNQNATGPLGENARAAFESAEKEAYPGMGDPSDRNVDLLFQFPAFLP